MRSNNNTFMQQVGAYKSFIKSFEQSMKTGKTVGDSIKESTKVYQKIIGENMKTNMRNDYKNLGDDLKNYQNFIRKYKIESQKDIDDMILRMHELYDNQEQTERMIDNFKEAMDQMKEAANDTSQNIKGSFGSAADWLQILQLNKLTNSIDSGTNTLLQSSNNLQQLGIGSQVDVKSFRDFVSSTAEQLNKDTGNKYNLKDMYADIATLAENTNIARMDTLKEITKPTMLAYKSMNVSLESIADFTGKLYEFAGIDSLKTEGLLDYVKTISNGMNVNEQDIMDNMNALSNTILAQAKTRNYDEDKITELLESVASTTTYLESAGLDSGYMTGLLKDFMDNPYTSDAYRSFSTVTGMDSNEIMNMILTEGGMQDFVELFNENLSRIYSENPDTANYMFENAYGIDSSYAQQAYIANDDLLNKIKGDMQNNLENPTTMEESVGDQYISVTDSIDNKLSTTLTLLTDIKEKLGFGFDDVINTIATIGTIRNLFGGGSGGSGGSLLGKLFGRGTSGSARGGILSGLKGFGSSAALNLGVLGESLISAGGGSAAGASLGSLAATGAGSIAGGLLGGAGLVSGGIDIYRAITGKNKDGSSMSSEEKQDSAFAGGTKIGMVGTGAAAGAAIGSVIPGLGTLVGGLIGAGVGGVGALISGTELGHALSDAWDVTKDKASELWDNVTEWGAEAFDNVKEFGSEAFDKVKEFGSDALSGVKSFLEDPIGSIKSTASDAWKEIKSFGSDVGAFFSNLSGGVPSYDVGTNYVPNDQLAMVHEGEAIIPKEYNDLNTLRRNQVSSGSVYNDENVEKMLNTLNSLLVKVNDLLTSFNTYCEDVEKRYESEKLDNRINTNRAILNAKTGGVLPSLRSSWGY